MRYLNIRLAAFESLHLFFFVGIYHVNQILTAGQLALAWVLAQGKDIVPIPGTTRRSHLEQNIAAVDLNLTQSDLSEIAAALPPGAASGTRYPEEMMRLVNL